MGRRKKLIILKSVQYFCKNNQDVLEHINYNGENWNSSGSCKTQRYKLFVADGYQEMMPKGDDYLFPAP
jgi:hypothetical protein